MITYSSQQHMACGHISGLHPGLKCGWNRYSGTNSSEDVSGCIRDVSRDVSWTRYLNKDQEYKSITILMVQTNFKWIPNETFWWSKQVSNEISGQKHSNNSNRFLGWDMLWYIVKILCWFFAEFFYRILITLCQESICIQGGILTSFPQ